MCGDFKSIAEDYCISTCSRGCGLEGMIAGWIDNNAQCNHVAELHNPRTTKTEIM